MHAVLHKTALGVTSTAPWKARKYGEFYGPTTLDLKGERKERARLSISGGGFISVELWVHSLTPCIFPNASRRKDPRGIRSLPRMRLSVQSVLSTAKKRDSVIILLESKTVLYKHGRNIL